MEGWKNGKKRMRKQEYGKERRREGEKKKFLFAY
jgi:hypothetical protein